jgi:8-oxo-dGTP diphosphatase
MGDATRANEQLAETPARRLAVTLECFVRKGDRYLMLCRNPKKRIMPGVWMGPGGHREECEGLFECARREILEETGLLIRNLRVRAVGVAYMRDLNLELHFHLLTADHAGGELVESPEDGQFIWLTAEQILNLDGLLSELRHVLPHVFGKDDRIVSYRAVYQTGNEMTEFALEDDGWES